MGCVKCGSKLDCPSSVWGSHSSPNAQLIYSLLCVCDEDLLLVNICVSHLFLQNSKWQLVKISELHADLCTLTQIGVLYWVWLRWRGSHYQRCNLVYFSLQSSFSVLKPVRARSGKAAGIPFMSPPKGPGTVTVAKLLSHRVLHRRS